MTKGKKIKFTKEQISEICKLYSEVGLNSEGIGKIFGVCACTIIKHLRNNDVEIKDPNGKLKISPGDKFGKWIIIKEVERDKHGLRQFLCECSCKDKNRKKVGLGSLRNGDSTSCGCKHKERKRSGKNYIGQTFGRLTILYEVERDKNGQRTVMAQCSCDGNIREYRLQGIVSRNTTSCGCYAIEEMVKRTLQVKDYQERYPLFCKIEEIMDDPNDYGILIRCKHSECRKWFKPTSNQLRQRINAIESSWRYSLGTEYNFYCSDNCKNLCPLYKLRSDPFELPDNGNVPTDYELDIWRDQVIENQFKEFGKNFCEICGEEYEIYHAHHILPVKLFPGFALDPDNGMILCPKHHYEYGHKDECSTGALAKVICTKAA